MALHSLEGRLRLTGNALFVATLCSIMLLMLPVLGLFLPQEDMLANEKRKIAPFPPCASLGDWVSFPKSFEAYFADRFAYRQQLMRTHHRLLIKLFGRSPLHKVLISEDGWLFFQELQGNAIDLYHRNIKPFSEKEMQVIHEEMTRRQQWVESWGGKAIFMLVPSKETIYPEHLPSIFQRQANPMSRYDQWAEIVTNDPSLSHIDLRNALRVGKSQGLIYFRGDSHWNFDGAYIGYRELVNALRQWYPGTSLVARSEKAGPKTFQGDLARMLDVGDWFDEIDNAADSSPQNGTTTKCAKLAPSISGGLPIPEKCEPTVYECNNTNLPTAVLIRDSMANRWRPWLPDNFRRIVLMSNWRPAAEVVERERPDVVIFETVERSLEQYLSVHLVFDPIAKNNRFTWER